MGKLHWLTLKMLQACYENRVKFIFDEYILLDVILYISSWDPYFNEYSLNAFLGMTFNLSE